MTQEIWKGRVSSEPAEWWREKEKILWGRGGAYIFPSMGSPPGLYPPLT